MKPIFDVDLVEGWKAQVHEGDPAYAVCQALRKAGYRRFVLPLSVVVTGDAGGLCMEDPTTPELAAAWVDQRQVLNDEASCTHHWLIDTPKNDMMDAVCKYCGETKTFTYPQDSFEDYSNSPTWTRKDRSTAKAMREDHLARLRDAEALIEHHPRIDTIRPMAGMEDENDEDA